ncbi:TPA: GIY-YIG nuclease family protein, partial [Neisseria gonorrhoeae]
MNASNWSVYLILCENSAFYCGISPNPQQRLAI